MSEFVPIEHFYRLARIWWLVVIAGLVGGGVWYMIHRSQTPKYESRATFYVTIDLMILQRLNLPADQYQYNEDLALNVTHAVLVSPEVLTSVVDECSQQGILVSEEELLENSTIERKHAFWELRFRHHDPQISRLVANLWAEKGYETMLNWSRTGKAANYVIFTPPTLASLPQTSVDYGRNQLMLAGFLMGFVAGILFTEIIAFLGK